MKEEITMAVMLTVTYKTNGVKVETFTRLLQEAMNDIASRGLLTGETKAEVLSWENTIMENLLPGEEPA